MCYVLCVALSDLLVRCFFVGSYLVGCDFSLPDLVNYGFVTPVYCFVFPDCGGYGFLVVFGILLVGRHTDSYALGLSGGGYYVDLQNLDLEYIVHFCVCFGVFCILGLMGLPALSLCS